MGALLGENHNAGRVAKKVGVVACSAHLADTVVNDHPPVPSQNGRSARADF